MYLIHNDPLLYDSVHEKRVECRALNIPEELGQVQYMFCDKVSKLFYMYGFYEGKIFIMPPPSSGCQLGGKTSVS